jgi:hypothetical protein
LLILCLARPTAQLINRLTGRDAGAGRGRAAGYFDEQTIEEVMADTFLLSPVKAVW